MKIKSMIVTSALIMSFMAHSHDEGHGPKLVDAGKYGGVVAPVIKKAEVKKGRKAELVYKAELVRSGTTVRVYLYDSKMKKLTLDGFSKAAKGKVEFKKGKGWDTEKFNLAIKEGSFTGEFKVPSKRPFNIDVEMDQGNNNLFVAFDNLD